jgi:hypothetical protein
LPGPAWQGLWCALLLHPWRCLCLGSLQMTMTRPCRRMIRHLLQIFFTLGLTFTLVSSSAVPPHGRFAVGSGMCSAEFAYLYR